MQVKVMSPTGEEVAYSCKGYRKHEEGGSIIVRALPSGEEVSIPRDGDVIFIENDEGRTINTWRIDNSNGSDNTSRKQPSFRALQRGNGPYRPGAELDED